MEDLADLDQLQAAYKAAVDAGLDAIRREEALASVTHDVAEVDKWKRAASRRRSCVRRHTRPRRSMKRRCGSNFSGFDVGSACFASLIEKFRIKQTPLVKD
jgi:hypothetical protein